MKKIIAAILIVFSLLSLLSCTAVSEETTMSSTPILTTAESQEETTVIPSATGGNPFSFITDDVQENPQNLELLLEAERFPVETKILKVFLRNYDNRYFIADNETVLSYWNGDEWQELLIDTSKPMEDNPQLSLAHPNENNGYSQAYLSISLTGYDFVFCKGKYRLSKTIGEKTFSVCFELY